MKMENNESNGILSEVDLLELLNVEKPTLDKLRRKENLPYVRLDAKNRVYLLSSVKQYLKNREISG